MALPPTDYWNQVGTAWRKEARQSHWRLCSDAIHQAWLERKGLRVEGLRILKTDLFDEAFGGGLIEWLKNRGGRTIGLDLSFAVASQARCRGAAQTAIVGDVRQLPLADGSIGCVLSNSTLDHFTTGEDLERSLRELHRALRRDGRLLLTLDNPLHPVVALRNRMTRLLRRLGLLPYFVGVTCGPRRLRDLLERVGFEVLETNAILHSPRVLLVAICNQLDQRQVPARLSEPARAALLACERLSMLPSRFLTGHFIAVEARKR